MGASESEVFWFQCKWDGHVSEDEKRWKRHLCGYRGKSKEGRGTGCANVLRYKPANGQELSEPGEGEPEAPRETWARAALSSTVASSHTWLSSSSSVPSSN